MLKTVSGRRGHIQSTWVNEVGVGPFGKVVQCPLSLITKWSVECAWQGLNTDKLGTGQHFVKTRSDLI